MDQPAPRSRFSFGPSDDLGAVMVEYALVLSLLSIVLLGGMHAVESATYTAMNNVETELGYYGLRNNQ